MDSAMTDLLTVFRCLAKYSAMFLGLTVHFPAFPVEWTRQAPETQLRAWVRRCLAAVTPYLVAVWLYLVVGWPCPALASHFQGFVLQE
jgi:hypothetical protein